MSALALEIVEKSSAQLAHGCDPNNGRIGNRLAGLQREFALDSADHSIACDSTFGNGVLEAKEHIPRNYRRAQNRTRDLRTAHINIEQARSEEHTSELQ